MDHQPKTTEFAPKGGPLGLRLVVTHMGTGRPDTYAVEVDDLISCLVSTTDPTKALKLLAEVEAEAGILAAALKRASGVYPVQVSTTLTKEAAEAAKASP